jgi:hypothetical protein
MVVVLDDLDNALMQHLPLIQAGLDGPGLPAPCLPALRLEAEAIPPCGVR